MPPTSKTMLTRLGHPDTGSPYTIVLITITMIKITAAKLDKIPEDYKEV